MGAEMGAVDWGRDLEHWDSSMAAEVPALSRKKSLRCIGLMDVEASLSQIF